jgi:hypothetical protein
MERDGRHEPSEFPFEAQRQVQQQFQAHDLNPESALSEPDNDCFITVFAQRKRMARDGILTDTDMNSSLLLPNANNNKTPVTFFTLAVWINWKCRQLYTTNNNNYY